VINIDNPYAAKARFMQHKFNLLTAMQTENDNPYHSMHIREFAEYADTTAKAHAQEACDQLLNLLPKLVQQEVMKQLDQGKVKVEVDKQSANVAKKAIDDIVSSLRKLFG